VEGLQEGLFTVRTVLVVCITVSVPQTAIPIWPRGFKKAIVLVSIRPERRKCAYRCFHTSASTVGGSSKSKQTVAPGGFSASFPFKVSCCLSLPLGGMDGVFLFFFASVLLPAHNSPTHNPRVKNETPFLSLSSNHCSSFIHKRLKHLSVS